MTRSEVLTELSLLRSPVLNDPNSRYVVEVPIII